MEHKLQIKICLSKPQPKLILYSNLFLLVILIDLISVDYFDDTFGRYDSISYRQAQINSKCVNSCLNLVVHLHAKVVSLLIGTNQKQLKELKIIFKKSGSSAEL